MAYRDRAKNLLVTHASEASNLSCAGHYAPDSPVDSGWNMGYADG
jgi:hypothetical protein